MRFAAILAASAVVTLAAHARAQHAAPKSSATAPASSAAPSSSAPLPPYMQAQADRVARADKRFHDGEQLFEQKKYEGACEAFAESQRLDPKLGTLLNIAYCHEAQGKTATAWREYSEAAAWASQQGRADRVVFAQDRAAALAKNVARIDLQLPDDALLEIDGIAQPQAHFSAHVLVDPGIRKFRVSAPGKVAFEMELAVPQGAWSHTVHVPPLLEELTKPPPPSAPAATVAPAPAPPPDDTKVVLAYTAGGVGVAALVIGGVFAARALDANGTASSHCTRDKCDATGAASVSDAKSFGTVSVVSLVVGVAAVAGGAYLYFTSDKAPARAARVSPMLGPRVGGIAVSGTF